MGTFKETSLWVLSSGLPYKILRSRALLGSPTTILCYHTLGSDHDKTDAWTVLRVSDFRRQVEYLRTHYDIVSLDHALSPPRPGERPRAVLTFDDGDVGLFDCLLPIVEAENLPVTIYIATAQIENGQAYWFDRIMNVLQNPGQTIIDLTDDGLKRWSIGPETGNARWLLISDILEALKTVSPSQREILTQKVVLQAGPVRSNCAPLAPLSLSQLQALAANPWVTIGSHSHCHNLLDQIPLDDARESILRSRSLLEIWTRREICHFAYPNGNQNAPLRAAIEQMNFDSATILGMELASGTADTFALPRIAIGRYDSLHRFKLRIAGI